MKKKKKLSTTKANLRRKSIHLVPELVPKPLFGISLYRLLPRAKWELIRNQELTISKNRCAICLDVGPGLICHEQWFYDDGKSIAMLIGFEIHCQECDLVTHMGRAFQK